MRERIPMPQDRLVPLEGTLNFRDLGGYVGRHGRTVRWGLVFRSDALHELTESDRETLRGIGLRAIYDLRKAHERERQPTALPDDHGHRAVHLAVDEDPDSANAPDIIDQIMDGSLPEADDAYMADVYAQILLKGARVFGRLLTHLTEDDGLPALFHCAAGKDRTGIAAALLLSVLGVDDEVILDDYELTNIYRSNRRIEVLRPTLEAAGVDVEKVRPFLSARRPVLEATLRHLAADHGGVESYLLGPAGMQPETLARLQELLLE
jgi:protein-tyrosine phosphatase